MDFISLIKLDKNIKKIYTYLVELMEIKGIYDSSLDIQIFNVAAQIYQYSKLVNSFVEESAIIQQDVRGGGTSKKKNPLLADLVSLSESLRKNLKELGLSLDSKVTAVQDNDPLSKMIDAMNKIDEE